MRIEVFEGAPKGTKVHERPQFYWHVIARNGKRVAQGEGHPSRRNAIRAAEGLLKGILGPYYDAACITHVERNGVTRIEWAA